jgi:polar amino acid transport system substrate-binding protein
MLLHAERPYHVAQSAVHRYSTIRFTVLKVLSIPFLAASLFASAAAQAQSIQLYIQEYGPFTHTDPQSGEIKGFLTEKVAEIMKRAKETPVFTSTSLARGLNSAMTESNACLFGFRRTQEREKFFNWVGPLTTDTWVLYKRRDDQRMLKQFEDAKTNSIGSYKNAATGLQLTEQGYNIQFASTDEDNPRLLINKRIDYWIVSESHGMFLAQQQGFGNDIARAVKYRQIELYMLCYPGMDKQRIDNFNRINKELDHEGLTEKLQRKYGIR